MKKQPCIAIISTIFLITVASHSFAQIAKGTFRLGPELTFNSNKTQYDILGVDLTNTNLNLGVQAGYYMIDNLELGLLFEITSSNSKIDNAEQSSGGIGIGPVIEYKIDLSPVTYFDFGGGLAYNSVTSEDENGAEATFTGVSYKFFGGLEYIVNNKLGAFISVGPEFGTFKEKDSDLQFDITNISVGMGFGFYF